MKRKILSSIATLLCLGIFTACSANRESSNNDTSSEIEETFSVNKDDPSESSEPEEVMRSDIKLKIDLAFGWMEMGHKEYLDLTKKYGDFSNIPAAERDRVEYDIEQAINKLEEAERLQGEIIEMVDRGELNAAEMKYYLEKNEDYLEKFGD